MKLIAAFITLALAISVVSASIGATVQQCIDSIQDVANQANVLEAGISSWTPASGYLGVVSLHYQEQILESKLQTAIDDCCAIIPPVNSDEVYGIFLAVKALAEAFILLLGTIASRKPDFDSVSNATDIFRTILMNLRDLVDQLLVCILNGVGDSGGVGQDPSTGFSIQYYVDAIRDAFESVFTLYGI